jgi:hypothetical protein
MMTQQLNVCVLAAPLAAIDRRALSQAWYSALHCTSGKQTQAATTSKIQSASGKIAVRPLQTHRDEDRRAPAAQRRSVSGDKTNVRDTCPVATDRRAGRSALASRIERTFLHPRSAVRRATFVSGGKRVHVLIHASEGRIRLVAVCPLAIRGAVASALAQARFALASRGLECF